MFVPKQRCEKTCRWFIKHQIVAGYHRQLGKIIPTCIKRLLFICIIMQNQRVIFRNMWRKINSPLYKHELLGQIFQKGVFNSIAVMHPLPLDWPQYRFCTLSSTAKVIFWLTAILPLMWDSLVICVPIRVQKKRWERVLFSSWGVRIAVTV